MAMEIRPKRCGEFEEWPLSHLAVVGGMLLLMFLEGALIVSIFGGLHVVVLIVLWVASFPVIQFSLCRKCLYYGKRCPVPGEGNLANLLFEKKEGPAGFMDYMGVVLCYAMRLGYPAIFLFLYPEKYSRLTGLIYALTIVLFFMILANVIGCPNCMKTECPMNPDAGKVN